MRATEKSWCSVCKFLTYGCRHEPEGPRLPMAFQPLPAAPWRKPELTLLGFEETIAPGATAMIRRDPQAHFRPLRFHVAPECAAWFDLVDLRFGNMSKFIAAGALPASAFVPPAELADLEKVPFDNIKGIGVVMCGMSIVLLVTNRSGATAEFRAMMAGEALHT